MEVLLSIVLNNPVNTNVMELESLVTLWRIRFKKISTISRNAILIIPEQKYTKMFGKRPKVGRQDVPEVLSFINQMELNVRES